MRYFNEPHMFASGSDPFYDVAGFLAAFPPFIMLIQVQIE